mmetsp:Transcript_8978/g.21352  ORF Transcript_8978/g.21352 Transcript_8978/m.21352 type:complete len:215 (-) Transcript_8978:672-1316(-)
MAGPTSTPSRAPLRRPPPWPCASSVGQPGCSNGSQNHHQRCKGASCCLVHCSAGQNWERLSGTQIQTYHCTIAGGDDQAVSTAQRHVASSSERAGMIRPQVAGPRHIPIGTERLGNDKVVFGNHRKYGAVPCSRNTGAERTIIEPLNGTTVNDVDATLLTTHSKDDSMLINRKRNKHTCIDSHTLQERPTSRHDMDTSITRGKVDPVQSHDKRP